MVVMTPHSTKKFHHRPLILSLNAQNTSEFLNFPPCIPTLCGCLVNMRKHGKLKFLGINIGELFG